MKWIHLSDLHLGKKVNGFSMLPDQKYILDEIINIAQNEGVDAALIAGDIYDRPVPPTEAVSLMDDFLVELSGICPVLMIYGNHDSPERIAFAGRLLDKSRIYVSPVFDGQIRKVTLMSKEDVAEETDFYLLPHIKTAYVRKINPDREINNKTEALQTIMDSLSLNSKHQNVLIAHEFVAGSTSCDSEEVMVGGADLIESKVFEAFDYVAMGHLHRAQMSGGHKIRYCGSPLKYSFSETPGQKSVTIVETQDREDYKINEIPLTPLHDMRKLRGSYDEIMKKGFDLSSHDDYMHITLTDEEDILDGAARLRSIYPNLMQLSYDNTRTRTQGDIEGISGEIRETPQELFNEFYNFRNGNLPDEKQQEYLVKLMKQVWEEES